MMRHYDVAWALRSETAPGSRVPGHNIPGSTHQFHAVRILPNNTTATIWPTIPGNLIRYGRDDGGGTSLGRSGSRQQHECRHDRRTTRSGDINFVKYDLIFHLSFIGSGAGHLVLFGVVFGQTCPS